MSRRRIRIRDDHGQVSVFLAIALTAVIVMIGLSVDAAGQFREMQRADNIAAEAARAGGQAIDAGLAISGGAKVVDPQLAVAAAQAYLADAGVTGEVTIAADRLHLTVTVTIPYNTVMLDYIGISRVTVTGRATAQLITG
jgi:hypothetical protein